MDEEQRLKRLFGDTPNATTSERSAIQWVYGQWHSSGLPADMIALYVCAGINLREAFKQWQPRLRAGEDILTELEMMCGLRGTSERLAAYRKDAA